MKNLFSRRGLSSRLHLSSCGEKDGALVIADTLPLCYTEHVTSGKLKKLLQLVFSNFDMPWLLTMIIIMQIINIFSSASSLICR